MTIDEDTDFSLSQKDTQLLQRVAPRPEIPMRPQAPKRTRLERLSLSMTTTALMQAIKRVPVQCLPEYFEQTCDRRPRDTAVICESSQLTYRDLDYRANRLAHFLISRGVENGNPIGILLERSLDTYITLLGVLKAGAAFVPLDPSFSSDSVAFIAQDAGLRGLVTTSKFREKTSALSCPVLELDQAYEALSLQPGTRPQVRVDPASLCYIIYMWDATSQPKGVAFSHANIVNFLRVATPIYGVTHSDRVYQGMSIAIDSSFEEIWPTWIAGATLVADPTAPQHLGYRFTEFLIERRITVLYCSPRLLSAIDRDVPSLRLILISHQACPSYLVQRWARPGRRMLNTYGPTETTVTATCCELFPTRPITLGFPLPIYQIYILDDQFHPVSDGESGEIYIGGPGLAIGYLNHPNLTRERFIPNPILRDRATVPRLYRTGDFGRLTPAGEIEYLGQIDVQTTKLLPIPQASLASLSEYAPAPPFEARSTSGFEAGTSKPGILSRLNVKKIYNQAMTDPLYRNSIFNMASTFMLGGLGFVFWIIVARLYTTEDVGIATTIISIMALLTSLVVLGLNTSIDRYLPRSASKNELINSSFVIVTVVTIFVSIIFLLGLQSFSPKLLFLQSNYFYIVSFTILLIFSSWSILVDSIFMAFRSADKIFVKNAIISIVKLILPFAFVALGAYGIFAASLSASAVGVIFSLVILIISFKIKPSIVINMPFIKETLAFSLANHVATFMFTMPSLVLPVVILNVISAKYAAYYYVASMIQNVLQVIPAATAQSLLIEGAYNEAELKKHVKKSILTVIAFLIPAIAITVFGGNIMLQSFGKNYATEALLFLQLYSVSTIFIAIFMIASTIMKIKHQIKLLVIWSVIANVLILALSYAFISGKLVGVGWGWLLGQAITGLISLFFIIRTFMTRTYSGTLPSKSH